MRYKLKNELKKAIESVSNINDDDSRSAKEQIEDFGFKVTTISNNELNFFLNGNIIKYFVSKSWSCGRGIIDCRGLNSLLAQLDVLTD